MKRQIKIVYDEEFIRRMKCYQVPFIEIEKRILNFSRIPIRKNLTLDHDSSLKILKSLFDLPKDAFVCFVCFEQRIMCFDFVVCSSEFPELKRIDPLPIVDFSEKRMPKNEDLHSKKNSKS